MMLSGRDQELISAAKEAIARRYRNDWQEVGAALRTRDGRIFTGVNLDAYLGRMAVCAEAVALGRAVTEAGETGIETIVAVRHPEPTERDPTLALRYPNRSCLGDTPDAWGCSGHRLQERVPGGGSRGTGRRGRSGSAPRASPC